MKYNCCFLKALTLQIRILSLHFSSLKSVRISIRSYKVNVNKTTNVVLKCLMFCGMLQIKTDTKDQGHFLIKAIAKRGPTGLNKRPVIERLLLS